MVFESSADDGTQYVYYEDSGKMYVFYEITDVSKTYYTYELGDDVKNIVGLYNYKPFGTDTNFIYILKVILKNHVNISRTNLNEQSYIKITTEDYEIWLTPDNYSELQINYKGQYENQKIEKGIVIDEDVELPNIEEYELVVFDEN